MSKECIFKKYSYHVHLPDFFSSYLKLHYVISPLFYIFLKTKVDVHYLSCFKIVHSLQIYLVHLCENSCRRFVYLFVCFLGNRTVKAQGVCIYTSITVGRCLVLRYHWPQLLLTFVDVCWSLFTSDRGKQCSLKQMPGKTLTLHRDYLVKENCFPTMRCGKEFCC